MFGKIVPILCFCLLPLGAAAEVSRQTAHADLMLKAFDNGENITAEVKISPAEGWYIHSHVPGEFGMPAQAKWQDKTTLIAEEWSEGEDILYEGLGLNAYKDFGIYRALVADENDGTPRLRISFTACRDECFPEHAEFELSAQSFSLDKPNDVEKPSFPQPKNGWLKVILLAFAGGLLLNLMPCVFPVLFIKIIGVVREKDYRRRVFDALAYFCGVMLCFLIMAGLLDFLKTRGQALGWGFQLQSPWFVGSLAVVFMILALMFLDVIKLNVNINSNSYGAFLTGLLAVLIASPCSAPFMGAAVGLVLTAQVSSWLFYAVFSALGAGYALPFFCAEIFPHPLSKILPRPGKWMLWLKRLMAVPMILTCIWLLWVLKTDIAAGENWETFDKTTIETAVQRGDKMFIDFTAKWCLTCLVNEKAVLNTKKFAALAQKHGIKTFKADWTAYNADITAALDKFGRGSVPLYVYFDGQKYNILPQILTFDVVDKMFAEKPAK